MSRKHETKLIKHGEGTKLRECIKDKEFMGIQGKENIMRMKQKTKKKGGGEKH